MRRTQAVFLHDCNTISDPSSGTKPQRNANADATGRRHKALRPVAR
jgi:hypothetical protein